MPLELRDGALGAPEEPKEEPAEPNEEEPEPAAPKEEEPEPPAPEPESPPPPTLRELRARAKDDRRARFASKMFG